MTSRAIALVVLSALIHAVWSVAIKSSRDPVIFNWLQMVPGAVLAIALLAVLPEARALGADFWSIAAAAGLCHALYMYWMGRAFETGDLSLVYPIARSTPAFLPFAAAPLLGERLSGAGALGIGTVVVGMWLVQTEGRLRWSELRQPAALFAWLTLLSTVGYGLTDKAAMTHLEAAPWDAPVARAVFYFAITTLAGAIALTPLVMARGGRAIPALARTEWGRALGALVLSLAGYSLILEALRTSPASYVVAVRQSSVIFAVALSVLWLHERPSRARLLGATIVVVGVILVGLRG